MDKQLLFKDLKTKSAGGKSYLSLLSNIDLWRKSLGKQSQNSTEYSNPTAIYFKPFFYFDAVSGDLKGSRLLGLDVDSYTLNGDMGIGKNVPFGGVYGATKNIQNAPKEFTYGVCNSAINYLLVNNEDERAELLLQFIKLLSDISTYEPWTFQQISGLDEALNRKYFSEGEFKLDETRKFITIKCLTEGYNSKISTLMDLYRSICYSYKWKKEILPANLRKFDMGVYIFSQPIRQFHTNEEYAEFEVKDKSYKAKYDGNNNNKYYTSVKYIELLNCEFDYNSCIKNYGDMNNTEGKYVESELKICFDDCYEIRYNEFLMRTIGDEIFQDTDFKCENDYYQIDDPETLSKLSKKTKYDELKRVNLPKLDNTVNDVLNFIGLGNLTSNSINKNLNKLRNNMEHKITEKLPNNRLGNIVESVIKRGFSAIKL